MALQKHRDEWKRTNWSKIKGLGERTIEVITAVGAISGSTGNLRTAARALGNESFQDAQAFADSIGEWSAQVFDHCRNALGY